MAGYRLGAPAGTALDRSRELRFTLDGRVFTGLAGDTLASALLAAGERFIGRSFKYHRPRGIASCGVEEPTGLLDVGEGARRTPNCRATDVMLSDGIVARTGNAWPSLRWDLGAVNGLFGKALTAGFYYKTFMWPNWHLFEPAIRRAAGLGHAADGADPDRYDEVTLQAEVLVVGAGVAGLEAATAAAETGRQVLLLEADAWAGGWAMTQASPELAPLLARARQVGVEIRCSTTVFGLYDHGLAVAIAPGDSRVRERTLKVRAGRTILATGAFDRPMLFPDNDRPGVMFAHAAERYARHYGAAVGRHVVLATACDAGLQLAERLRCLGLSVDAVLDRREGDCIVGVVGRSGVRAVRVARPDGSGRRELPCDALLHTGGLTPSVGLHSQAGGGLRWDEPAAMFVPARLAPGVDVVGACAGAFDANAAREHARRIGRGERAAAPVGGLGRVPADNATPTSARRRGKVFVDLQNDVCASDIAQAAQENYRSVEHLKRYTTTGMATDQGKNSNVNALVMMGGLTGRAPAAVGTTKFRPPFTPVTLGAIAAGRTGERYRPLRRLPAHAFHADHGACFEDFGGWLRPAAYPQPGETLEAAAKREAAQTRRGVSLFEASPLGKLEVFGPDAATFLDLMYVGTMSTLPVGSARYGLLLGENGVVVDDGIVARLGPQHFWVNTTSSGVERTALAFEEWLQCERMDLRVLVQPVTSQWGTVTLAGPQAWALLAAAGFDAALAPAAMKHMTLRDIDNAGTRMRVLRASFSGELGYELSLPALQAQALIERLWQVGQGAGLEPGLYGIEALMLMRLEKGYLHIGADTDGTTLPQDVGMLRGLDKKAADFVGRRSLLSEAGRDASRKQLVGLLSLDRHTQLPVGAHICEHRPPAPIDGFVTSSGFSPALGHPVAMAMLARGMQRLGERVRVFHMNQTMEAEVVKMPFFDAVGERLHG